MCFEDVRNALVVAYADDSLDDEEFVKRFFTIFTSPLIHHMRGALGPIRNCKTVEKNHPKLKNRKTEKKFDQNRKLHAKLS